MSIERRDGLDLDGNCRSDGVCGDNELGALGAIYNEQLLLELLGGEKLMIIEIAGYEPDAIGNDPAVTFKLYRAADADVPFFPANNFRIPPGRTECCGFNIRVGSLDGDQARVRIRARVRGGVLETTQAGATRDFPIAEFLPGARFEATAEALALHARFELGVSTIRGLLGGALSARGLAEVDVPGCEEGSCLHPVGKHALDHLMSLSFQPDIDLDGDGLACLRDSDGDGHVDRCCPTGCDADSTCANATSAEDCLQSRAADALSFAFVLGATRARVLGFAP